MRTDEICSRGKKKGKTSGWLIWQHRPCQSRGPPTWNRSAEGHEDHGGDRVFEADGAAEMGGQVPGDGRQDADEGNRHEEAGPAVPVLGGRDKGEKDFPENSQEVHDVIKAGGQALFAALFLIIITWQRQSRWTGCHEHPPVGETGAALPHGGNGLSGRRALTCAHGDGADELLSPAAAAHHQRQVGLLDQLVHRALQTGARGETSASAGAVLKPRHAVKQGAVKDVTPPIVVHGELSGLSTLQGNSHGPGTKLLCMYPHKAERLEYDVPGGPDGIWERPCH